MATTMGRTRQPPTRTVAYPTSQRSTSGKASRSSINRVTRSFAASLAAAARPDGAWGSSFRSPAHDVDPEFQLGGAARFQRQRAGGSQNGRPGQNSSPEVRTSLTSTSTFSRTLRVSLVISMGTTRSSPQRA